MDAGIWMEASQIDVLNSIFTMGSKAKYHDRNTFCLTLLYVCRGTRTVQNAQCDKLQPIVEAPAGFGFIKWPDKR
jgi:hypothetical protein